MPVPDPTVFEWWSQIVIPSVGSLAALAAAVVSVVALVISRSARSGVENIREGLNRESVAVRTPVNVVDEVGVSDHVSATLRTEDAPASWEMSRRGGAISFRNTSGETLTLRDIEGTGNHPITVRFDLPAEIPDDASFQVGYHRVLGGSAVIGVTLWWTAGDRPGWISQTFYV